MPTGTITISQNGTPVASLSLTGGAASWTSPGFAAGQHTLLVQYSGDALHAASSQQFVQVAQAAPAPQTQAVPSLGGWALALLGALMLAWACGAGQPWAEGADVAGLANAARRRRKAKA